MDNGPAKSYDEQVSGAAEKIPSPDEAFGRGGTHTYALMTFPQVLEALKEIDGSDTRKFARRGWNGNGLFIQAQFPDEHSKMGNPYLFINAKALGGELNPWVPSQTDLFAEDWVAA